MKIALCLSGHVRNIETTYNSLKKYLLDNNKVDIFLHAWDTLGWRVEGKVEKDFKGFDFYTSKVDQKKIINLLNPIDYKFENYEDFEKEFIEKAKIYKNQLRVPDRDRPENTVSLTYKTNACNILKKQYEIKNNFTYDIVIRSRFDIEYYENVVDDIIISNKDKYIFSPYEESHGFSSDILTISNSKNMDIYCELYNNLDNLYKAGCLMNPHNINKFWLDSNFGQKSVNYNFNIKLNRCRKNCENKIVCYGCHPENKFFSRKETV